MTLARRTAIDLLRRTETRRKYHRRCAEETPRLFDDPAPADAALCRDALEAAIASLPPEQREVTVMHLWAGLTFQQIAETLEIPANTAASRFRYALTKLRPLLQPLYDEIR